MDAYPLAKLVECAETLRTRKRLQKTVYLLQAAGYRLNAEFTLHHYGPYSADLAQRTDAMVHAGLLEEQESPNSRGGRSFSYQLSPLGLNQLARVEKAPGTRERLGGLDRFEQLARRLLQEPDLPKLEFAATITYFRNQVTGGAWPAARKAAAAFKKQEPDGRVMRDAESFAREVLEPENPD
jgi:hypothetical protein